MRLKGVKQFILDFMQGLLGPTAGGCVYDEEKPVGVEGALKRKIFSWKIADKERIPDVVAVPMDRFVFRLIDLAPENRSVLAGQINRFFPFPSTVPRCIEAYSRILLSDPMISSVGSPL